MPSIKVNNSNKKTNKKVNISFRKIAILTLFTVLFTFFSFQISRMIIKYNVNKENHAKLIKQIEQKEKEYNRKYNIYNDMVNNLKEKGVEFNDESIYKINNNNVTQTVDGADAKGKGNID